jgi:hypothetical protein
MRLISFDVFTQKESERENIIFILRTPISSLTYNISVECRVGKMFV